MPDSKAATLAKKIVVKWIYHYGVPEQILTDRGTNFQSVLTEFIYDCFDIKRMGTTPYYPQCDGNLRYLLELLSK